MHGAPGGQTGANIDDCIDDVPRLFTDEDSWKKAITLWHELAVHFGDRMEVGGYDLLNEPIAPYTEGRKKDYDDLLSRLKQFYGENTNEWYVAFYPLCASLGIGYNLWPWKKAD